VCVPLTGDGRSSGAWRSDLKNILITGASDGIGRELARIYRTRGDRVLLTGRRSSTELDPAFFRDVCDSDAYCSADFEQPDSVERVTRFVDDRGVDRLDLVIPNAGTGYAGPVVAQSEYDVRRVVEVNLTAALRLTHRLYKRVHLADGKIVFVGSVVAAFPSPDYAVYGATKAALDAFGRALGAEGSVEVLVLHPGATRTGMHAKLGLQPGAIGWDRFPSAHRTAERMERAIDRKCGVTAVGAANRIGWFAGKRFAAVVDAGFSWRRT
jgi:short-subunit dehydrogenase